MTAKPNPRVRTRRRLQRLVGGVLDVSLREVLRSVGVPHWLGATARDPLARRFAGGQLKPLPSEYIRTRDRAISEVVAAVCAGSTTLEQALGSPPLARLDERVVEYTVIAQRLARLAAEGRPVELLDVGCVLNNRLVSEHVKRATSQLWLMNPAIEPLVYEREVVYVLADVRQWPLSETQRFDLVTCLSVLEHVGMDNSRYGDSGSVLDHDPEHPERFAAEAMAALARRVKPGGLLLVSVPYGVFEYVYEYGRSNAPIYYSFDREMLDVLLEPITAWSKDVTIYKPRPSEGWVRTTTLDKSFPRYADGIVGAGGVAIIAAQAPLTAS